jgi:hypothetical protein
MAVAHRLKGMLRNLTTDHIPVGSPMLTEVATDSVFATGVETIIDPVKSAMQPAFTSKWMPNVGF